MSIILSNEVELPNICFGTGVRSGSTKKSLTTKIKQYIRGSGEKVDFTQIVKANIENGCHMFDTSRAYGTAEYELGEGFKRIENKSQFCGFNIKVVQ